MITRAHIRNFRCLVDVDLTFEPLTILVGPNASGKSAILDALDRNQGLAIHNGWRHEVTPTVMVAHDDSPLNPRDSTSYTSQCLHLDVRLLRGANQLQEAKLLDRQGINLTNVFATLTRSEQSALVERLVELVPMYRDVAARPSSAGMHRLVFQDHWAPQLWHEPENVSDGTILLLAFLLIQHQSVVPSVLCIEEPERALHPYLVGELMKTLRYLAMGKFGPRAIQVVLATHSAELLEFAEPTEVRFVSRRIGDGATQVEQAPTGTEDWANAVKEYHGSLGGLWLSGSLGGVPGG
jgi:predicted ATPase